MRSFASRLFCRTPPHRILRDDPCPRVMLLDHCLPGLVRCLGPEIQRGHEGVAYFYGQTDGITTLIAGAIRPVARTTRGSFEVSPLAMARVVETVCDMGLHLVGQVHSHPTIAAHSAGDEDGARIAYDGFVSIVLPDYGRRLPTLDGTATYMYRRGEFLDVSASMVTIIPGVLP